VTDLAAPFLVWARIRIETHNLLPKVQRLPLNSEVEKFASPAASWSIYSATQITVLPGSCPSIVTYTHPHHPLTQIGSLVRSWAFLGKR
jgi:hypothetical protein